MKIGFTAKGIEWDSQIDPRFGRTDYILVFDEENKNLTSIDNTDIANEAHGAGPQTAKKLADLGVEVLITGNGPGGNAKTVVDKIGLTVFIGAEGKTVKEAYNAYKNNELEKF